MPLKHIPVVIIIFSTLIILLLLLEFVEVETNFLSNRTLGAISEMTTKLNLNELHNDTLQKIKNQEFIQERGADVEVHLKC